MQRGKERDSRTVRSRLLVAANVSQSVLLFLLHPNHNTLFPSSVDFASIPHVSLVLHQPFSTDRYPGCQEIVIPPSSPALYFFKQSYPPGIVDFTYITVTHNGTSATPLNPLPVSLRHRTLRFATVPTQTSWPSFSTNGSYRPP